MPIPIYRTSSPMWQTGTAAAGATGSGGQHSSPSARGLPPPQVGGRVPGGGGRPVYRTSTNTGRVIRPARAMNRSTVTGGGGSGIRHYPVRLIILTLRGIDIEPSRTSIMQAASSRGGMSHTGNTVLQPRLPRGVDLKTYNVADTSAVTTGDNTYYVRVCDLRFGRPTRYPLKQNGNCLTPDEVPYSDLVSGRYLAMPSQETAHGYPLWYNVHDLAPEI